MKTIFFDFGNVVGFFDHFQTLNRLVPHTDQTVEQMYASVFATRLEDDVERGAMNVDAFLRQVHGLWQLRCDLEFLSQAICDIFTPNPEVCGLIPLLRPRYRVLLASNTNDLHATQFRRQFAEVFHYFDGLVLSHEIGFRKPQPEFYAHCQSLAQADPSECVFIDDMPMNIDAARTHGWHGIVYKPGEDLAGKLRALGVSL
jgi:putative hydrolase of the HAD superfamily